MVVALTTVAMYGWAVGVLKSLTDNQVAFNLPTNFITQKLSFMITKSVSITSAYTVTADETSAPFQAALTRYRLSASFDKTASDLVDYVAKNIASEGNRALIPHIGYPKVNGFCVNLDYYIGIDIVQTGQEPSVVITAA